MLQNDLKIGAIIFGILCAGTISLEIYFAEEGKTPLETTLFGVLQFLFSVVFAWFIARSAYEREFHARQKSFAISAYRRIREISRAAERLLHRTTSHDDKLPKELRHELEVLREISLGICDTAVSSVSDWADLIGEEISTIEQIEDLRSRNVDSSTDKDAEADEGSESDKLGEASYNDSAKILALIDKLPPALKAEVHSRARSESPYVKKQERFNDVMKANRYVDVLAFWESEAGLDPEGEQISGDKKLRIAIGDAKNRVATLLVLDEDGRKLGICMNDDDRWGPGPYHDFVHAITDAVGFSNFPVVKGDDLWTSEKSGRHYFTVRIPWASRRRRIRRSPRDLTSDEQK